MKKKTPVNRRSPFSGLGAMYLSPMALASDGNHRKRVFRTGVNNLTTVKKWGQTPFLTHFFLPVAANGQVELGGAGGEQGQVGAVLAVFYAHHELDVGQCFIVFNTIEATVNATLQVVGE